MLFIYNFGIAFLRIVYCFASLFNKKARALYLGKKNQKKIFNQTFPLPMTTTIVWVHCASVGEFEQGRPIIEGIKRMNSSIKIVLTFFSPSGYELRKNYEYADFVFYLPWDTLSNSSDFIEKLRPTIAIFVKYEFWYHYISQLYHRKIALISISAHFRESQFVFKPYVKFFRSMLLKFDHIFVQNQESIDLLKAHNITNATSVGDCRIDRVYQIAGQKKQIEGISKFKNSKKVFIAGSVWPDDMRVLNSFILANKELKFIIAPHEIDEKSIHKIEQRFKDRCVRYSNYLLEGQTDFQILIIDNVGILSQLYQYGEYAFIGGGFRQGLHNILEPSSFGMPIFFGNRKYKKFAEAIALITMGGAFEVGTSEDLVQKLRKLEANSEMYANACKVTKQYVLNNIGATEKIIKFCENIFAR